MSLSYRRANPLMLLVASSMTTPQAILAQLASEDDPELLAHIAGNENTHPLTLAYLSRNNDSRVRSAVARHKKLPFEVACHLKNDRQTDVRMALAANPHLSDQITSSLCDDDDPQVCARAGLTLDRTFVRTRSANEFITMLDIAQVTWLRSEAV